MSLFPCWLEEEDACYDPGGDYAPAPLAALSSVAQQEYWATLALRHCKGLGARSLVKLLHTFGGAYGACRHFRQWGQWVPQRLVQEFQREQWRQGATAEWEKAKGSAASILLWQSSLYPPRLRQLPDAPAILYLVGDNTLLNGPTVAVVGSRQPSAWGVQLAHTFGRELAAAGITVVSGMALGIDRAAHQGALALPGSTVGVLGTGVDLIYPQGNRQLFADVAREGLLVSEFPLGTRPNAVNFPIRNRIISGLSLGVLVVEAAVRSGSLVTASLALEQNREVFAIAGPPMDAHSIGCQNLLRQGARPVFCVDDILRDLQCHLTQFPITAPPSPLPKRVQLTSELPVPPAVDVTPPASPSPKPCAAAEGLLASDQATRVLGTLQRGALQVDALSEATGLSSAQLAGVLLGLELTGQVRRLPGAVFQAV